MLKPKRDFLRRLLAVSAGLCVTLALQTSALGLGNETVMVKQRSSSLQGVVTDPSGEALEKVSVSSCDNSFHQCSEVITTDRSGRFSIASRKDHKIYYLRFSLDGMDPEEVVVTLKHGTGLLNIKMIVAT